MIPIVAVQAHSSFRGKSAALFDYAGSQRPHVVPLATDRDNDNRTPRFHQSLDSCWLAHLENWP
jgi:hypothetical protein